jgi:hypothetical protein
MPAGHWREPFGRLADDLEQQAALTPLGRTVANGQLVGLLDARIRAERLLARHPESASNPCRRRSSSWGRCARAPHGCSDCSPATPAWLHALVRTLFPVPSGPLRPRRMASRRGPCDPARTQPAVQQIHPSGPLRPDEEFGFLSFAFHSGQFAGAVERAQPSGTRGTARSPSGGARASHPLATQPLGTRSPRCERPVLKCPAYSGMADALLAAFPDCPADVP